MSVIEQAIVNGILQGGIYAVIAVGINLIYGVLKIINFAHGEFIALSMYLTFWLTTLYSLNLALTGVIVLLIMTIFGYIIVRFLIEPILKDPELNQLLITFALSIILQNIFLLLWGADFRSIRVESFSYNIGGVSIPHYKLMAFFGAVASTLLLYIILMRTKLGIWIRAVAQDPITSQALGINSKAIRAIVFIIGTVLAGLAGLLITPIYYIYPTVGLPFGLMAWVIMVLGGLGSMTGALIAGFIVGLFESLIATFYNVELARAFIFVIFIATLAIRPTGLLGGRARV
ncbi:MAG: branched-chain amino acid ABC transporter permease [Sulfolobales archaeon]